MEQVWWCSLSHSTYLINLCWMEFGGMLLSLLQTPVWLAKALSASGHNRDYDDDSLNTPNQTAHASTARRHSLHSIRRYCTMLMLYIHFLILIIILKGIYYFPHFTDEETNAEVNKAIALAVGDSQLSVCLQSQCSLHSDPCPPFSPLCP